MQISIVYHSGYKHTKTVAEHILKGAQTLSVNVSLIDVEEAIKQPELLSTADTIVLGSPTYFGNVSASFKKFMESTSGIWLEQRWKNKMAAGFTNSSSYSGDKLHTLTSIMLFAAQHSMLWVPLGIMPAYNDAGDPQKGMNETGSYLGLMTYSGKDTNVFRPPSDLETAFAFGKRIAAVTLEFNNHNPQQ